jgi:hypothetical protein
MPYNPFEGDTGLKSDYDGTIDSALFIQEQNGWRLNLVIEADDGESAVLKLGVGKAFTSIDGGETVQVPGSNTPKYNSNTAMYRFMRAAMDAGAGEVLMDRSEKLYEGLGPFHANMWVGLRFHFDVEMDMDAQRMNEAGGWEKVEGGRPWIKPTEYLGLVEEKKAEGAINDADMASLVATAKAATDHRDFMTKVMGLEADDGTKMAKNTAVVVRLKDESWFEALKEG